MKGGARSENIVDQEQVLRTGRVGVWILVGTQVVAGVDADETVDDVRAYTEGALDVCSFAFDG